MLPALARRCLLNALVHQHHARHIAARRLHATDDSQGQVERAQGKPGRLEVLLGQREQQLVIVAAIEDRLAGALLAKRRDQLRRQRQFAKLQRRRQLTGTTDVCQIAHHAIGDIQARTGQLTQRQPRIDPRFWSQVGRQARIQHIAYAILPGLEASMRQPRQAGDRDEIPLTGTITPQNRAGHAVGLLGRLEHARQLAMHGDRDGERAARDVAAHQRDAVAIRQRMETGRKTMQPVFIHVRQRQSQQRPARGRAHRRQIRQIDGQGAMANGRRRRIRREVHPRHRGIDTDRHLHAITGGKKCTVVTRPQQHARCPGQIALEVAGNQLEFTWHVSAGGPGSPRHCAA